MEFFKIVPQKEKTEEEKLWEQNAVLSDAVGLLTEEYPEKFGENIRGRIDDKTIILSGDLDILKSEAHQRFLGINGEKEKYTIILRN